MWYQVSGSDSTQSELTDTLLHEWIDIHIGSDKTRITNDIDHIIHTEAIAQDHEELVQAHKLEIATYTYSQALWAVANGHKLIAIAGTHGKSTTTSFTSLVLKNSQEYFSTIVWTLLKEFWGKNFYTRTLQPSPKNESYFVIEACEYKRHFLEYQPVLGIITNIEIDHLDYYKNNSDYLSAFQSFIANIIPWWYAIINGDDTNCQKLLGLRDDIQYIQVFWEYFLMWEEKIFFPKLEMQVPGKHILFDAHIAYIIGHMVWIDDISILDALEEYTGVWRRMESIKKTNNNNTLMSDYGHHPTEISLTLESIKQKYPDKKLLTVFQPHQYNRTLELLEWFKTCFTHTDILIIPNIYESRDSEADKQKINSEKLVELIDHPDVIDGNGIENTLEYIQHFNTTHSDAIILLLWAGDVDNMRYKI